VLGQEASHYDLAILFGSGVFAIAAVEFFDHPPGERSFVSFDCLEVLGMAAHVLG
jgi:hypothetical protein